MRTAIIGMGVTGFSCLRYLAGRDTLAVLDTRDEPPNGAAARAACPDAEFRFGAAADGFDFRGVDRVVVSPGVGLDHPLAQRARAAGARIDSDIDLFCQAARAPIYAITGTNGKSTVTALTGHVLARLGRSPGVGGNLGEPALDLLADDRDCYVLELSSFQLERMAEHAFEAAVILNVTDDHLDRHGTLESYAAAKQRIFARTRRAVANRDDPVTWPAAPVPELVTFGAGRPEAGHWGLGDQDGAPHLFHGEVPVMPAADLPIGGRHNALNVLAVFALVSGPGVGDRELAEAVQGFAGLPHRCRVVAQKHGVTYIDDSKATNVGATLAALDGLAGSGERRLVLIAGGDGKGADFSVLAAPVRRHVKAVVLLGRDAPLLARALEGAAPIERVSDMPEAVQAAARAAVPGDVVLLSPACASLDMFRNYAARGEAFAAAVEALR
ncbi:MAG TPA: UDP-N-acetylmuramoyl-L-alanine--D-glutamate ligase [Pseudomonadales bacterium]